MWVIEWTAPARWRNGYSGEAGDAAAEDVAEVISDWDRGVHEGAGKWFDVTWLVQDDASRSRNALAGRPSTLTV